MTGRSGASSRILGHVKGVMSGPCVVVTGGIHGNEGAGVLAAKRVVVALERGIPLHGELLALTGNVRALREGRRYRERDLNRNWYPADVTRICEGATGDAEDVEQRELLECLAPWLADAKLPVVFVDLHSTSGPGQPFCCLADVLRNRPIAFALGIPVVLGLEEVIEGSMLGYLCDLGHVGIAVEGGQNDAPETVDNLESAIWIALAAAGALARAHVPDLPAHEERLRKRAGTTPRVLEIRYRHVVRPDDGFLMEPGFSSFQEVERGQVVASDQHGVIRSPETGVMLLPRYQGQGEDGFFIAKGVGMAWLGVSAILRRLRLDRGVPLLPGVHAHETMEDAFLADARIARLFTVEIFHLFGYRHVRARPSSLVFSRRRRDGESIVRPAAVAALLKA